MDGSLIIDNFVKNKTYQKFCSKERISSSKTRKHGFKTELTDVNRYFVLLCKEAYKFH